MTTDRSIKLSTALVFGTLLIALAALLSFDYAKTNVPRYFHELFYYSDKTWQANKWMGILTQQNPNDVWITQEIIYEVKPDFIIETGTLNGGSALIWAMLLEQINPEGKVITVDIEDLSGEAKKRQIAQQKVQFLLGSSTSPEIIEKISAQVQGKRVLVILDSDHRKDHVLKELQLYSPFVPVGSYIIVQDSNVSGHPIEWGDGPGPMEAIEEFLQKNTTFESDLSRERLLFTMYPKGYLKRVRP